MPKEVQIVPEEIQIIKEILAQRQIDAEIINTRISFFENLLAQIEKFDILKSSITDKDGITHVIKQLSKGSIKVLIAPETNFSRAEKITVEDVAGTTTTKKGVSTAAVRGDPADEDEWEE